MLAMLVSYLANDTWSLPSLSRSTHFWKMNGQFMMYNLLMHYRVDIIQCRDKIQYWKMERTAALKLSSPQHCSAPTANLAVW